MILIIVISLIATILTLIIIKWNYERRHLRRAAAKLPGLPALPILGNALQFWCKPEELLDRLNAAMVPFGKSPTRAWLGPKLYICILDPENAKRVLSSNQCLDKDDLYRFLGTVAGEGLISGSGEIWRQHRKLIQPTFNNTTLTQYLEIFQKEASTLVNILSGQVGKDYFDILQYAHCCTIDVVMETIIDVQCNAQTNPNTELVHSLEVIYNHLHTRMLKVWLHPDFIFYLSGFGRSQNQVVKRIRGCLRDALRKKQDQLKAPFSEFENGPKRNICSAEFLLRFMDSNPGRLSEKELIDEVLTLFLASEDTTASNYAYAMMFCGMYPEVQDKIYREMQIILGDKEIMEKTDLDQLKYMEMVINECLRLIPIAPIILRKINADFELNDFTIPAKAGCLINLFAIHRDPKYWEKPTSFYPEHWLDEAVAARHSHAFIPFSAGPRKCIGKSYAIYLIKTMLVYSLRNYRVEAKGKFEDLKIYSDISCRVTGGCRIKLFRR